MNNEITDTAQQIARELRAVLARTDWAAEAGHTETEWQEAAIPERVNALCAALLQDEPQPTGWDERAMHWRAVDSGRSSHLALRLADAMGSPSKMAIPGDDEAVCKAAAELRRLHSVEVERDQLAADKQALIDSIREELDEGLRLRELGGAGQDENITAMTERVIRERDAMKVEVINRGDWLVEWRKAQAEVRDSEAERDKLRAEAGKMIEALRHAKNSLVAFKFMPVGNAWEEHDEANLNSVDAAIDAARGEQPANPDAALHAAVEQILTAGHMDQEDLARLRAAYSAGE